MKFHKYVGLAFGYFEAMLLITVIIRNWSLITTFKLEGEEILCVLIATITLSCVLWLWAVHEDKKYNSIWNILQDVTCFMLLNFIAVCVAEMVKGQDNKQIIETIGLLALGAVFYLIWVCIKRFLYYSVWRVEHAISSGKKTFRNLWYSSMGYENGSNLADTQLNVTYEA